MVANNSEMRWQVVTRCDNCGSQTTSLYLESDIPRWYGGRPLRLVQCDACGLVFASPRPYLEDLYAYYLTGEGDAQSVLERKLKRANVREIHRKHVMNAIAYLGYRPQSLFDMGCGAGTTLSAARELGIETWGNDVNKAAVDMLRAEHHNVLLGFTTDVELPHAAFDIVLNFDYLEHSYTPLEDLRICFDILKPGGVMYLKTLYLGCPDHIEKGPYWQLFGIGHFHFFNLELLTTMVEGCGFEIIEVKCGQLVFLAARRPDDSRP